MRRHKSRDLRRPATRLLCLIPRDRVCVIRHACPRGIRQCPCQTAAGSATMLGLTELCKDHDRQRPSLRDARGTGDRSYSRSRLARRRSFPCAAPAPVPLPPSPSLYALRFACPALPAPATPLSVDRRSFPEPKPSSRVIRVRSSRRSSLTCSSSSRRHSSRPPSSRITRARSSRRSLPRRCSSSRMAFSARAVGSLASAAQTARTAHPVRAPRLSPMRLARGAAVTETRRCPPCGPPATSRHTDLGRSCRICRAERWPQ